MLFISRVYRCDKVHQALAHDPDILSQTLLLTELFLLFHKDGIRELYEFIISHVDIGITPSDILALWHQMKYDYLVSLNLEYQKWKGANLRLSQDAFEESLPLVEMEEFDNGMKVIPACLVESYFSKETLHTAKMAETDAKTISADYPFKV